MAEIDSVTIEQKQKFVLTEFHSGKDILAVIPTGFGKSLIYQLASLVMKMFCFADWLKEFVCQDVHSLPVPAR